MNNSPRDIAAFRRVTNNSVQYSHKKKKCIKCLKHKSTGQFKKSEYVCDLCSKG